MFYNRRSRYISDDKNTFAYCTEETKVRESLSACERTWKISRYSKYGGRAEYQIRRNELPCANSPIVRDLIGDCRELSVFKPRVFDTRVACNIVI